MYEKLVEALREYTEWAKRNEWETPIMLSDHLKQAADAIEELTMKLHGDEAAIAGMKREIERMVVNKPRWIPVTERLPEPVVNVLAIYGDGRMDIDWVDHEGCFVYESLYDGVTHWMQLPEPLKEET